jgi:hypothetical protein
MMVFSSKLAEQGKKTFGTLFGKAKEQLNKINEGINSSAYVRVVVRRCPKSRLTRKFLQLSFLCKHLLTRSLSETTNIDRLEPTFSSPSPWVDPPLVRFKCRARASSTTDFCSHRIPGYVSERMFIVKVKVWYWSCLVCRIRLASPPRRHFRQCFFDLDASRNQLQARRFRHLSVRRAQERFLYAMILFSSSPKLTSLSSPSPAKLGLLPRQSVSLLDDKKKDDDSDDDDLEYVRSPFDDDWGREGKSDVFVSQSQSARIPNAI